MAWTSQQLNRFSLFLQALKALKDTHDQLGDATKAVKLIGLPAANDATNYPPQGGNPVRLISEMDYVTAQKYENAIGLFALLDIFMNYQFTVGGNQAAAVVTAFQNLLNTNAPTLKPGNNNVSKTPLDAIEELLQ